jgi:hypothetical protein
MSGLSAKISFWIKIFIFGLSRPSNLTYVVMWRFHGAWIRSELLMRKICHGPSLYVILSKVTLYQFLEEVQATKIQSSNPRSHLPKILLGYLLTIFILSNPYLRCWSKISWKKEFSRLSKSKFFFQEILIFCWQYSLNGYPTPPIIGSSLSSFSIILKRTWTSNGIPQLSSQNRTVQF